MQNNATKTLPTSSNDKKTYKTPQMQLTNAIYSHKPKENIANSKRNVEHYATFATPSFGSNIPLPPTEAILARYIPTLGSQQIPCPPSAAAGLGNPKSDCTATIGPNGIGDAKSAGGGGTAGNGVVFSVALVAEEVGG